MISSNARNRLIIGAALLLVIGFVGRQMFFSLAPPRHADHDHAMASLDAGGFLTIEAAGGQRRNLVGRPGKVLILHFFDPRAVAAEEAQAAQFSNSLADDDAVEVVFVARSHEWPSATEAAQTAGIPTQQLYIDKDGRTSTMLGVRRWPETLIYDHVGLLVHQAKGPMDWTSPALRSQISRAQGGVQEID